MRIIRALEVYQLTGKSISSYQRDGEYDQFPMDFVKIGLNIERASLYQRIDLRVEQMMADGLLEEVKSLKGKGFTPKLKALKTVGYQELFEYLDGKTDLPKAVEKIKLNTRHYAKRQLTWFKKDSRIAWLNGEDKGIVEKIADRFLSG